MDFENEVRRIARNLWPEAEFDGSYIFSGRERDGVFFTEECIHIVEATTSRKLDKAKKDIRKSVKLAQKFQSTYPARAVKCWFITQHEPTPDQRDVARNHRGLVVAVSFNQFQSKLINAKSYLSARDNYAFGSVRDPKTNSTKVSIDYIPLDLVESETSNLWDIDKLCDHIQQGGRAILLGDYGAGKSMTLREIYLGLRKLYLRNEITRFPVYLNLRDHHGQTNPAEVLERHARNIGYGSPSHLVRAWRSGYVYLILDGFDEITTLGWVGKWKKLQDARYRSMEVIRAFVTETPLETGLVLAGRAYFFDGDKERSRALATNPSYVELNLNDFSDEQIESYLEKFGHGGMIPSWLPSRPLLLGTLVARGLLENIIDSSDKKVKVVDPAVGWDLLINQITSRESQIGAGIDGVTLRRIFERLATKARFSPDGLGPLTMEEITSAFSEICGYPPDEQGMLLLQRLPGLGIDQEEEGTRKFIDSDLVDVCRSGDIIEFLTTPYSFDIQALVGAEHAMRNLGVSVAAKHLSSPKASGTFNPALDKASEPYETGVLMVDILRVAIVQRWDVQKPIRVQGALVPYIELPSQIGDLSRVEFRDCYFNRLEIDNQVEGSHLPRFQDCYFTEVDGRVLEKDLPKAKFLGDCIFDRFVGSLETTSAILELDLPLGTRITLSVLKKLYEQRGSGRRQNALFRGLSHRERRLVPDVLKLLQAEGLATNYPRGNDTIWLPDRSQQARVRKMIGAPTTSRDSLLIRSRDLS